MMSEMRIAILHYTLPPVIGGVERVIRDQAAALQKLGHEVECFADRAAFRGWLQAVERGWPHPQAIPDINRPASDDTRAPQAAVIVHNVFTMPFDLEWTRELTALAAEHPQIRWINWVHDVCAVNPAYEHIEWREPVPQAVHVAVSEVRRADYMRATGLPEPGIQVIHNGLDLASMLGLSPRIAALRLGESDLVLLHPARLVRRKNIEFGLRVTAALIAAGCSTLYVITGAPDPHQTDGAVYHGELRSLAQALGISRQVLFLGAEGPLTDEDVRGLYEVADALFFPSTGEGFGLPLLEALAHRLPVFCSDLPVHQEVLGQAGHYFQSDEDPAKISARIMRWYAETQPTRHRKFLRQRFDMVKICQEHLEPLLLTAIECPVT